MLEQGDEIGLQRYLAGIAAARKRATSHCPRCLQRGSKTVRVLTDSGQPEIVCGRCGHSSPFGKTSTETAVNR